MSDAPSILLLTEDSGNDGFPTLAALVEKILRHIDPEVSIEHIELEPLDDPSARQSLRGNAWKGDGAGAEFHRRDLVRSIATKLLEDEGFVVFHIDGDRTFKQRKTCENTKKFEKTMDTRIRQLLSDKLQGKSAVDARMRRLFVLVPFYSIESWLYQNTDEAINLCRTRYQGRDIAQFKDWRSNRKQLDEVHKPKEATCLGARHNRELAANAFPFAEAYDAGKSLKQSADKLVQSPELRAALAETRAPLMREKD